MPPPPHEQRDANPMAALRRFVRPRAAARERCGLCDAELPEEHAHLVEPQERRLVCACDPCAILFAHRDGTKFRRVPRRIELLSDFQLTDSQWESLNLPIGLAFFLHSSPLGKTVAVYPGPAGATESLPVEAWAELVAGNPAIADLEPDVEAVLANRVGTARVYFRVGIDVCYKLVGLIRTHWRGLSGGEIVWEEIDSFFARLRQASA